MPPFIGFPIISPWLSPYHSSLFSILFTYHTQVQASSKVPFKAWHRPLPMHPGFQIILLEVPRLKYVMQAYASDAGSQSCQSCASENGGFRIWPLGHLTGEHDDNCDSSSNLGSLLLNKAMFDIWRWECLDRSLKEREKWIYIYIYSTYIYNYIYST